MPITHPEGLGGGRNYIVSGGSLGQRNAELVILWSVDELDDLRAIQPRTFTQLVDALGNAAVLDLIAIRASYVKLADVLLTYEVELDEYFKIKLPEQTARDPFVPCAVIGMPH